MGHIVWLASYPKSGNTWLRAFLQSLIDPEKRLDINRLGELFPYDVAAHYYQRLDPRPPTAYTRAEILAMRPRIQRMIAEAQPHMALVKTHSALVTEDGHPAIDPEVTAGALYLVRNPLDVAVSFSFHTGEAIDHVIDTMNLSHALAQSNEKAVSEHVGSWSENVESWTRRSDGSVHVARYEDMIEIPHKTFTDVVSFLKLAPKRSQLERALRQCSFRVLREQERRSGFVERPSTATTPFFRAGKTGEWRNALTPKQVDRLVDAHHGQMQRFGYLP
jgi:hypothetical protein